MPFDTKGETRFFKCKFTLFRVLVSVLKSPSQLEKVKFNKNGTASVINMSAGNWHFVTVQMQSENLPYVIFPFSSSSTALKRCVTSICDTPMAVFRIQAKSSSVTVPPSDWYSYESKQQDKSSNVNSCKQHYIEVKQNKFGIRNSSHFQTDVIYYGSQICLDKKYHHQFTCVCLESKACYNQKKVLHLHA